MAFGWFKKLGGKGRGLDDSRFDPDVDEVGFDELDATGEFIDDERSAPQLRPEPIRPAPPRPPIPRPPAPAPEVPRTTGPIPVMPPRPAPAPAPPAPRRVIPTDNDITGLYDPRTMGPRASAGPAPVQATPAAPVSPAPAVRPAGPMAHTPGPARSLPPPSVPMGDETVIMPVNAGAAHVVAWLVVASGPDLGKDFRLSSGTARIGLDAGEIPLSGDAYISIRHAEICYRQGQYELHDLGSTNGTMLNGVGVTEAILRDNDRLKLGETQLVFKSFSL